MTDKDVISALGLEPVTIRNGDETLVVRSPRASVSKADLRDVQRPALAKKTCLPFNLKALMAAWPVADKIHLMNF